MFNLLKDALSSSDVSKEGLEEEGEVRAAAGAGDAGGRSRTPSPSHAAGARTSKLQLAGPSTDITAAPTATDPKSGGGGGGLTLLGLGAALGLSGAATEPPPAVSTPLFAGTGVAANGGTMAARNAPPKGGQVISM